MFRLARIYNLKVPHVLGPFRQNSNFKSKLYAKTALIDSSDYTDQLIKQCAPKLIYNSVVERKVLKIERQQKAKRRQTEESVEPLPVSLKYVLDDIEVKSDDLPENRDNNNTKIINFPYNRAFSVEDVTVEEPTDRKPLDVASEANEEVRRRHEMQKEMSNWMADYDNYDDSSLDQETDLDVSEYKINYGTPDPSIAISNVPCGGCGALLHCKDTAIPGYIPSEIFKNSFLDGGATLEAIVCQRCHFLKHYNLALQVQVTPDDYPKVLASISRRGGLVVLMVDLLDFPCSIWPGIGEIFGYKTPLVVVGNKVDLLPQDSRNFLKRIKQTLLDYVKLQGFGSFDIKEVALISAKTGFGVEDLITRLSSLNRVKGDVYIVGCTNVGKSSLFNALIQSDYCKTQAIDLIQRATTSVWPGTTLNLLKFPIKRPAGYRQFLREKRLNLLHKIQVEESKLRKEQLRRTRDAKYASLIGHIGVTKNPSSEDREPSDLFAQGEATSGTLTMGVDDSLTHFAYSKWCFDTPGVVQPDQIIHLLTTEELLLTLPKELLVPRTLCLKPNSSLFIAGLARLDYVDGPTSIRFTVFASQELPLTVCAIEDAEEIYQKLLGTDLFRVPSGDSKRLSRWPSLELAKEFTVKGRSWYESSNDVVLSNAGWVAVTGKTELEYKLQAWTPEKRGVYIRDCLLPHAVGLSGKRIKHSVAYNKFRFYLKD
ncbi:nitric oxide-associated protein 1 [Tribolium castaneum]|uniref:Nitric oxide-associated protein 1-like Protein n=1 Tax=Tribolium castaneum TaxID=7070 RepID=D6X2C8_TRICA|nr:PREDICTED: nitric oxide-associated protein 1 [Tribolium castaneum]EFA10248.1 Nitric oxide-associated protein 1-like Protein [Tribolium castaneum]|eukprot:XP_971651.1 PREDICTED: nitric oxide-associated protein 1 [Tribolium castaneum]